MFPVVVSIRFLISFAAVELRCARLRTSPATTAKARAATQLGGFVDDSDALLAAFKEEFLAEVDGRRIGFGSPGDAIGTDV
jgi:hypothetical protein